MEDILKEALRRIGLLIAGLILSWVFMTLFLMVKLPTEIVDTPDFVIAAFVIVKGSLIALTAVFFVIGFGLFLLEPDAKLPIKKITRRKQNETK